MSNESVTDEIILEGFRSLHQAMAEGFDKVDKRFEQVDKRFIDLEARIDKRFADFDHRMMLRFDEVNERLDRHERRIATLETTA